MLHDAEPVQGRYVVFPKSLAARYDWRFTGRNLKLLDLNGALLKRLGGDAELSRSGDYALTQQWAHAVFDNPAAYDGFSYMSHHIRDGRAVILFDRRQQAHRRYLRAFAEGARLCDSGTCAWHPRRRCVGLARLARL